MSGSAWGVVDIIRSSIAHGPETPAAKVHIYHVEHDTHMINYLVDSLKVMDSDRESRELESDISPDLDSDDSMCWSDEYIDLTAESDVEPPAASHLDTTASMQSTNGANSHL